MATLPFLILMWWFACKMEDHYDKKYRIKNYDDDDGKSLIDSIENDLL